MLIPLYLEHEHSKVVNVLWKYVRLRGMELSLALEILQACRSLLACESGCSA